MPRACSHHCSGSCVCALALAASLAGCELLCPAAGPCPTCRRLVRTSGRNCAGHCGGSTAGSDSQHAKVSTRAAPDAARGDISSSPAARDAWDSCCEGQLLGWRGWDSAARQAAGARRPSRELRAPSVLRPRRLSCAGRAAPGQLERSATGRGFLAFPAGRGAGMLETDLAGVRSAPPYRHRGGRRGTRRSSSCKPHGVRMQALGLAATAHPCFCLPRRTKKGVGAGDTATGAGRSQGINSSGQARCVPSCAWGLCSPGAAACLLGLVSDLSPFPGRNENK